MDHHVAAPHQVERGVGHRQVRGRAALEREPGGDVGHEVAAGGAGEVEVALHRVDPQHAEAEVGREPDGVGALAAPDVDDAAVGAQVELAHHLQQHRRVPRCEALVEARREGRLQPRVGVVEERAIPGHGPSLPPPSRVTRMARRVFLHVGTAKSGTSFLQDLWWRHRDELRGRGLLLPGARRDHFAAAAVVKGMTAVVETLVDRERDAWRRLVEEARHWPGDVLLTNEHFADSPAEAARAALDDLADAADEVHVGRHGPRPRTGAPLGVAAAGQDGRPAGLPPLPRHGPSRRGRPEVLALPGRARDPRALVRRPPPTSAPTSSSYLLPARRARSCGCAPPRSSASTWPVSTPRPSAPTPPSAWSRRSSCDGSTSGCHGPSGPPS